MTLICQLNMQVQVGQWRYSWWGVHSRPHNKQWLSRTWGPPGEDCKYNNNNYYYYYYYWHCVRMAQARITKSLPSTLWKT